MSLEAFHGDASLKAEMIGRVRSMDADGKLLVMGVLHWDDEKSLYSFNGALAQTEDREEFIKKTGIPIELAQIVESTVALNTVSLPSKDAPFGLEFRSDEETRRYAAGWYESVRPGADLSGVMPKYMTYFLEFVLGSEFDLKEYISSAMRSAGERILANWKAELAGEKTDPKVWRAIRAEAVAANAGYDAAWTYPLAYFIETFAWPVRDMVAEFGQPYGFLCGNWLAFTRRPHFDEVDRMNSELSLKGFLLSDRLEKEGKGGQEEMQAMLDANPDIKRAMMLNSVDPEGYANYRQAQLRAFPATTPRVKKLLDQLVTFISEA
ncbi:hypothetical protein [Roseateles sp. P5_E11]